MFGLIMLAFSFCLLLGHASPGHQKDIKAFPSAPLSAVVDIQPFLRH
jgi:hypothetical protein